MKVRSTKKESWSRNMAGEPGNVMMECKGEENFKRRSLINNKKYGHCPFIHSTAVNHSHDLGILKGAEEKTISALQESRAQTIQYQKMNIIVQEVKDYQIIYAQIRGL